MKWSEQSIQRAIAEGFFKKAVLAVPNCGWTGYECDMLIIEPGLRIIDIEVKVSRADLKQDQHKDKWWHQRPWAKRSSRTPIRQPRLWPQKVWKHYYVVPLDIWTSELLQHIPANSGVLAVSTSQGLVKLDCLRRARPCREATPITARDAIDLARLASLRMWSALARTNQLT
jgi:hypothetical protein